MKKAPNFVVADTDHRFADLDWVEPRRGVSEVLEVRFEPIDGNWPHRICNIGFLLHYQRGLALFYEVNRRVHLPITELFESAFNRKESQSTNCVLMNQRQYLRPTPPNPKIIELSFLPTFPIHAGDMIYFRFDSYYDEEVEEAFTPNKRFYFPFDETSWRAEEQPSL